VSLYSTTETKEFQNEETHGTHSGEEAEKYNEKVVHLWSEGDEDGEEGPE